MQIIDSPGLRPLLMEDTDAHDIALMVAAGVMEPYAGLSQVVSEDKLVSLVLEAWNRHEDITGGGQPMYSEMLGCERTDDPKVM